MTFNWNQILALTSEEAESPRVSVFVVSTIPELLSLSLATARHLSKDLHARIQVLIPYVVADSSDLSHPPIELSLLVCKSLPENAVLTEVERARILLCRDKTESLLRALAPKSIVVLGAKKRWWRTREEALASKLRKAGHQVVVAYS